MSLWVQDHSLPQTLGEVCVYIQTLEEEKQLIQSQVPMAPNAMVTCLSNIYMVQTRIQVSLTVQKYHLHKYKQCFTHQKNSHSFYDTLPFPLSHLTLLLPVDHTGVCYATSSPGSHKDRCILNSWVCTRKEVVHLFYRRQNKILSCVPCCFHITIQHVDLSSYRSVPAREEQFSHWDWATSQ
jgi:hypothetical protein